MESHQIGSKEVKLHLQPSPRRLSTLSGSPFDSLTQAQPSTTTTQTPQTTANSGWMEVKLQLQLSPGCSSTPSSSPFGSPTQAQPSATTTHSPQGEAHGLLPQLTGPTN